MTGSTASVGSLGAHLLSPEENALIESFLSCQSALEPVVRYRMAEEVLRKVNPKLNLAPHSSLSTESILEALAYERRSTASYS